MTKPRKRKPWPKRRARAAADDSDVGYGKPPRAHQFKPGKSGNPKGRPKGAKSEETILRELLQQKISLNERGRARRITIHEGILPRRIKPGSELVRTWKGKSYRVMVMADGFAHDGKTFASLSEIASEITGTRWNGPRFFGLRSAPNREGADDR